MKRMVFLIGFMGSGKTYWAKRLASLLDVPCYDLDDMVEKFSNMPVKQIFEQAGEAVFRKFEQSVLHDSATLVPGIMATGGGTPCFFDNMEWLNAHGLTIYLNTPANLLAERLKHERLLRPLLADVTETDLEAHIAQLVAKRMPVYTQAAVCLEQSAANESGFEQMLLEAIKTAP